MRRRLSTTIAALALCGCPASPATPPPVPVPVPRSPPSIELVESWPSETELDAPDLRDAHVVWAELIGGARHSIEIGQFYLANREGGRLDPILHRLAERAQAGVEVRVLVDRLFRKNDPATYDRLEAQAGVTVRYYAPVPGTKGILHAKYFVVDGAVAYLGSHNFDWRSLEHIGELGVVLRDPAVVAPLRALFEADWRLAGGGDPGFVASTMSQGAAFGVVASPRVGLLDARSWDLPALCAALDAAERRVRVQLLSSEPTSRDGSPFPTLHDALVRAARRGVKVELLLSHWSSRAGTIEHLQALSREPNVQVRLVTIPTASTGFIPFARVIHAKYMVADDTVWVGTSNWSGDYFHESRNVGVLTRAPALARRLDAFFERYWAGPYAERVQADRVYAPPRIAE